LIVNPTGKITYEKPAYNLEERTVIPSASDRTYVPDKTGNLIGKVIVAGDPQLKASNIKAGVNIFGVTGTYEKTVTKTYTLGMFTINWAFDNWEEVEGDGLGGSRYYAFPTYTQTTIQATVGDITGTGTYVSQEGSWTIGSITRWTSSDKEVYMNREAWKSTQTATASTTLPNGTYNVELLGMARAYGQDSAANDSDFEWRGSVVPHSTMSVSGGKATVQVDLDADNYGWLPYNPTSYRPQYERIVFALKVK
jgi:hypothetical protein